MRGPAQTSEPVIQYLYQLVDAIAEGRLLIPRFQRPLVWQWDRQAELLRSVRDGIPMGAVMIWRTAGEKISWQDELAGHRLVAPRAEIPHEYLLDGLQRLSTLFAALKGHGPLRSENDAEIGTIGYDLSDRVFVPDQTEKASVIPLSVLSSSVTLLRFQRALRGPDAEQWVERSDELAKSFREYKVPVIPIVSDDFEVAARTFNLVNSQGVRMGEADMIHALTWSPTFELRDRIEALRSELLQPIGWGEIDFETVLKVVKAEADLDLYEESVEQVSRVLKDDPQALERAFERLKRVADFLRAECGIRDWDLVPYAVQSVLLADVFRQKEVDARLDLLRDWFWVTTYGEMFAGLSGYRLGVALKALRDSVRDGMLRWSGATPFRLRPLRATADFRAVRIKALALQLARRQSAARGSDEPFRLLADHKRMAMVQLVRRSVLTKDSFSSPGNRFLCAPQEVAALRLAILGGQIDGGLQAAHVIPDDATAAATDGQWDQFVAARTAALVDAEQVFVDDIVARHPHLAAERRFVPRASELLKAPSSTGEYASTAQYPLLAAHAQAPLSRDDRVFSHNNLRDGESMASAFVLTNSAAAKFRFNLRAGNNEIILTSEHYETKSGALNGIASVRKNAPDENRYVRKTATNGSPYFVLTAANGEIIGTSELYSTATARDNGISAVMKTAPDAPLVDNTQ